MHVTCACLFARSACACAQQWGRAGAEAAGARGQEQLRHNMDSLNAMTAFADDVGTCRRVLLMRHFGETFDPAHCHRAPPLKWLFLYPYLSLSLSLSLSPLVIKTYSSRLPLSTCPPGSIDTFVSGWAHEVVALGSGSACTPGSGAARADTCDNCIAARDGTSAFAEADMTAAARQVVDGVHALNSRDVQQDLEAADAFCKV